MQRKCHVTDGIIDKRSVKPRYIQVYYNIFNYILASILIRADLLYFGAIDLFLFLIKTQIVKIASHRHSFNL